MKTLTDTEGKEYKFEEYNGMLVQEGTVDKINKRVESERGQHEKKYADLEEKHNKLNTDHEELKKKHMTAEELQQENERKRQKEIDDLRADRDQKAILFKKNKIETDLLKEISSSGIEVVNAKQVMNLLRLEYDDIDIANDSDLVFKKGSNSLTAQEAVKTFLEDQSNANLLKNTLKPGGGTRQPGGLGTGKQVSRQEYDKLSPEAQMELSREVAQGKAELVD